jgi:hypothetical protein
LAYASKHIMCTFFIGDIGADIVWVWCPVYFTELLEEHFIIHYPSRSSEGSTALIQYKVYILAGVRRLF